MMRRAVLHVTLSSVVLVVAACGSDKAAMPTAPSTPVSSAPAPPTAGATTGATISGTVLGTSGVTSMARVRLSAGGMAVSVTGTSSSSTVDAAGHFLLQGVPAGRVDLHFSGAGSDAHLGLDDVAEHEDIHLTVHVSGTTADIDEHEREAAGQVEVEGRIAQISASARTMRLADTDVVVPAGATIRHGGTTMALTDIHVGDRVHVRGARSGAVVTASEIEVQNSGSSGPGSPVPTPAPTPAPTPKPDDGNDKGEVELSGTMASRSGTCPALTFTVSSTTVVTSTATTFKDTACSALANGDSVEVKGSKTSSGTVNATRVEKKK